MSRSSFPRPEHSALLRENITKILLCQPYPLEISERSLDHFRCCYRFGFRRSPGREWIELSIHFQLAERLENNPTSEELGQILNLFLERHFGKVGAENGSL